MEHFAVVLITLSALLHSTSAECQANLKEDLTQSNVPLFLAPSGGGAYELLQPTGASFDWSKSQQVVVGCSTAKNQLANIGASLASLTCIDGRQFTLNGGSSSNRLLLSDISCSSVVSGAIASRNVACAEGNGDSYDIGFEVSGVPFVRYFQACYNLQKQSAIYSEHLLPGQLLPYAQIGHTRPAFKVGGIPTRVSLATVYTRRHQQERLATLLGSASLANQYINSTSFFARGHLTPDGDAVLDTWAAATYFFINVVPQWQTVNAGNWLRVENAVRKVATQLNDTVLVYTGGHGVLELPGSTGRPVSVTLGEQGLVEVPKWLWKVVVHQRTSSAIVLITLNNPFVASGETLCEDVCARFGWELPEFQDVRRGFTYCCTVQEAQKAIKLIPKSIAAAHVLRNS